jgi:hypothetical protein
MKRILLIILLALLFIPPLVYYAVFAPDHVQTYHSPDGEYRLEVYARKKWVSMPGDGSTKCAKVELYKGFWRVWNDCPRCPAFTTDIDVRWDLEANKVWYAPARTLDLETGECAY